ncbi:MAG: hypothetical protein JSR18_14885 [Proteobacteria bacterium]|nr:hypothetical protein [Pseudomonadota bacterium]
MYRFDPLRRQWLGGAAALALAGCGGFSQPTSGASGAPLPAPDVKVGDRWVYSCRDGFRLPVVWTETWVVTAVAPQDIQVQVTGEGHVNFQRVEHWLAPGVVASGAVYDPDETRVFTPPLIRYQFPLTDGSSWRQSLRTPNAQTGFPSTIERTVRVGGFQSVTVPAGTFDVLAMRTLMSVDDNNPFRFPTNCNYITWWSEAAGAMVKMFKQATYMERGDGPQAMAIRAQNTSIELTSFRYGGRSA